ncbi:hypothetical protein Poli38472_001621 [Pythium oligandrum]|uniref:Uncharacterized protein n=1 Tax=Pythium oligandrum TaxID=41045 RepID=A0A8K1FMK4_PYTOL|nr:hypothetical protein Poli38472_001621 [Pythium oligandrum]|eukprot:TMW69465.1 hypothetical protein Poli38472_001621 [Pythium oligandrum]
MASLLRGRASSISVDVVGAFSAQTKMHRRKGSLAGDEFQALVQQTQVEVLGKDTEPSQAEIDALVALYDGDSDEYSDVDSMDDDEYSDVGPEEVIFKVLVVGNARCGKTSTIRRFVSKQFSDHYVSTIGADFVEKVIDYDDSLRLHLQLWDIAGQDRFAKLTRAYFREAKGALIVCDITRANTIDAVETWKNELDVCCKDLNHGETIPVVMLANKSDLLQDPLSALNLGVNMQKSVTRNGIVEWFRASAKSGEHIDEAFQCLIEQMVQAHRQQKRDTKETHPLDDDSHDKSSVIRLSQYAPPASRATDSDNGGICECN